MSLFNIFQTFKNSSERLSALLPDSNKYSSKLQWRSGQSE
jgi:hypothetical protein